MDNVTTISAAPAYSTYTAASVQSPVIDTSAWILKRDDERRFSQKTVGGAQNFTPIGQRKKTYFSAKQGHVALRSLVMESL